MSIRSELITELLKNKGDYISGEALSKKMFCSRNAVWKAVNSLKAGGFEIKSSTKLGYKLMSVPDIPDEDTVKGFLGAFGDTVDITVLDTAASTNDSVKELAAQGAKEGTVVIALNQTMGKGRLGRSFYSPRNTGVYLSILLRPDIPLSECLMITSAAAVATAQAIEAVSYKKALIKWVNDIYVDGKKVCGILTEASTDIEVGGLSYAVVGIGVNISDPPGGFPDELKDKVGSVFGKGPAVSRAELSAEIIRRFFALYKNLPNRDFLKEYADRSLIIGKQISVINGGESREATALEIDKNCRLKVRFLDGSEKWLSSGEVSVKPVNMKG